MLLNIVILIIAYFITLWIFRRWISNVSFKNVSLTPQRMRKIAVRTALLFLLLGWICWHYQLTAFRLFALIAGFSFICLAGGGLFAFNPLAGIPIIIYYVLFQWLLGFPDKDIWIPRNERYQPPISQLTHLIGRSGYVETPLRPIGEISIDGQKHIATSEIDFIDKGTFVTVIAVKNANLIVRTEKAKSAEN